MRPAIIVLAMVSALAANADAQPSARTGPVVTSGGPVFDVADPDFVTPMDVPLKAVVEMRIPPDEPSQTNAQLGTMARYLNVHGRAGVPRENIRVAAVVHGGASAALLMNEFYRAQHGVDNPNREMLREILAAGGQVVLCGQTAAARGITRDQLLPGVKVALSAMTALTVLQSQGYQMIPW